jgi:hypothetical protein
MPDVTDSAALKDCLGRLAPKALELICQRYYLAQHARRNREAFVELGASFREAGAREEAPIRFMCKVYAFEGEPSNLAAFWPPSADQIMGSGAKFILSKAIENQGWRTLTARCVMPSNAGFLVVQIGAGRPLAHGSAAPSLGEQFVDDISLTLHTRQTQHNLTSRK